MPIFRLSLPATAMALLIGLAHLPAAGQVQPDAAGEAPAASPSAAAPAAPPGAALPAQELTDTVLYEFLLAEIAMQRGNVGLAAQAYADLAKRTRDPRIARRATELAVFARMTTIATESARIWLDSDPGSARALQSLAGLLIASARLDEALPLLRQMLATRSADIGDAFTQLSRTLGAVQDKAAALRVARQLAQEYPRVPAAGLAVARAALAAKDEALALQQIAQVRSLQPESEQAVLLEAQIAQTHSNEQALQVLQEFLQRYPGSREVRINLARALVAVKRYPEARAEFQRLVDAFPQNAEVAYAVALLSLQLNDRGLAEAQLKRLLDMDFQDKNLVRLYLGQIAEEQKRNDEALQWFSQIESGEQYLPARIRAAQILAREGRLDDGRALIRDAEVEGEVQRVQLILAEAQLMRDFNQAPAAFELLEHALERQPDNPELLYDYGMLAERLDKLDILESSLRKLIGIRPDHAHAYNALGYSLADRNLRLPEARELIERALKLAPDDAFIIDSMGWVLFRQGASEEALKHLQRAYGMRPDPEIAAHLAEVLWALGRQGEAEQILKEVGERNPGNETILKTLQRLKR